MCKKCFSKYMHDRNEQIKLENGDRLQRLRENRRRYAQKDPEKEAERCRQKAKAQYWKHPEQCKENHRRWREANRERSRERSRLYQSQKYRTDQQYRNLLRVRCFLNSSFRRRGEVKSKRNEELTGLSSRELYDYLLSTFKNTYGYDWDFEEKVHIDHIVPLSSAKNYADVERLCHYTNLRLIKATDNLKKGVKTDYTIGGEA